MVLSAMSLGRRDEADATMAMFVVVPADEVSYPGPRLIQTAEAIVWPLGAVFQCSEQRLREGVVVTDPRPLTGRCDA